MNSTRSTLSIASTVILILVLNSTSAFGQARGSLRGLITDELGAAIVGASVTLTDAQGSQKKTATNAEGVYTFTGLAPGKYNLSATATGFAPSESREVDITGQRQSIDLTLKVTIEEKVTIGPDQTVSTEATANANQTVISGSDLDALPDDPDELAAALQALAGPSVGPNGGQIFIDGFTGGNLPSKDAIREIRINQNPFAAENDQPSGRIDILTRPGTDKLRGGASFNFNDESLNSRNPFAISSSKRAPFQIRQYNFNLNGPLIKRKASYFLEFGRIETDDNELIRATVLDSSLNPVYSSMPGVEVPPLTRFGLGALSRYDKEGYKITSIADKKKQRGFRIVDPEGYTTDFYIDPANGRLMSFLIYYQGFTFGTENTKFKEVDGVLVPFSFSQRFEMPQGAFFAEYSVKEVKLNQTLPEDAFAIPR